MTVGGVRSAPVEPETAAVLPSVIQIAEFTLSVPEQGGEGVAAAFRRELERELERTQPVLSLLYEVTIEEYEVWTGSRKSRNRVKMKRRKEPPPKVWKRFKAVGAGILFVLRVISIDYPQIEDNFHRAKAHVEAVFQGEDREAKIEALTVRAVPESAADDSRPRDNAP